MPTMRRSTRVAAAAKTQSEAGTPQKATRPKRSGSSKNPSQQANGTATEAAPAATAGMDWSVSSSPLSSISTPASIRPQSRSRNRNSRRQRTAKRAETSSEAEHSSESANEDAVSELLSRASEAIQDEVARNELSEEDASQKTKKGRLSPPALAATKLEPNDVNNSATGGRTPAKTKGEWRPGKRGRPPKHILEQRRLAAAQALESGEVSTGSAATPTRSRRAKRARMSASPAVEGILATAPAGSEEEKEEETDAAGEAKIGQDGQLLGGREYICPVFQSPFRPNTQQRLILSMDCCRFTGARDSYMLFKQHPRLTRIETTQEERDLLADRHMIPKVTRFRPIAMISARDAFREFGAKMVKDGRYITDDYWEARSRTEARFAEGTLVASMDVYRDVMAAHAAGMLPGPTRKPRRGTPLAHRTASLADGSATGSISRSGTPTLLGSFRMRNGSAMASPHSSAANGPWAAGDLQRLQRPVGGLTMASALQQQPPQLAQPSPLPGTDASQQKTSSGEPSAAMMALAKPMFRKTRSSETAEAAFEHAIAAHRAIFSDDISFVDGTPLLQSLAPSWPRLSAKHRPRRADASDSNADADADAGADDSEAKTAVGVAAGAMVRDFNASLRMWREDNGSTWIDPHTGIRQIPESLQPTAVQAERIDGSHGSAKIRTTIVDRLVSFVEDELPTSRDGVAALPGDYPLALLPGQYQHEFPVHQTRFGQTYEQAVTLYQYHWSRQLAVQQQMQMQQQQQLQRQQQQQQQQQNQQRQPPK